MSFEQMHTKFYTEIFQFAFQLSLSKTESKDLLQDAFMRLFSELNREVEIKNPRAWLYKVVLNLWRNKYNRDKRNQLNNAHFSRHESNIQTPEISFIKEEKRKLVFDCMAKLPANDRNILLLYHDGLSYAEIAEVLDMKRTSVGTTLSRSIKRLRLELKTKYNELFE